MLLPNCFVDFISLLLSYLVTYGLSMVPHIYLLVSVSMVPHIYLLVSVSMVPHIYLLVSVSMVPHIYLLVSVSMAPHTWSAIQKPVITQTIAVVAPTTNESMHIFKSFLRLIFNLLLSPCITLHHRPPPSEIIRYGNGPTA